MNTLFEPLSAVIFSQGGIMEIETLSVCFNIEKTIRNRTKSVFFQNYMDTQYLILVKGRKNK